MISCRWCSQPYIRPWYSITRAWTLLLACAFLPWDRVLRTHLSSPCTFQGYITVEHPTNRAAADVMTYHLLWVVGARRLDLSVEMGHIARLMTKKKSLQK